MNEKPTAVDCAVVTAELIVTAVPFTLVTQVFEPAKMPGPLTAIPATIPELAADKVIVVLELVPV